MLENHAGWSKRPAQLVVSQDRQPFLVRQRPWYWVSALARLVPALAAEGDALAPCRRPAALPDPRPLGEVPIVAIEDFPVAGPLGEGGDGEPVGPLPEPPVVDEPQPVARVERARSKRARMPRRSAVAEVVAEEVVAEPIPSTIAPPALTPREAQLLAALAADPAASSAVLGRGLGIAAGTVRKVLGTLREKLGVGSDVDGVGLVALARERGLLTGEAASGGGGRV